MSAPLVETVLTNSTTSATATWNVGSIAVAAGEELWAIVTGRVSEASAIAQDPTGDNNAFTVQSGAQIENPSGQSNVSIWRLAAPSAGTLDIQVSNGGTGEDVAITVLAISGIVSVGTADEETGAGTAIGLVLDAGANVLNLVGASKFDATEAFDPGTMTQRQNVNIGNNYFGVFTEVNDASPNVSWTTSANYAAAGISLVGSTSIDLGTTSFALSPQTLGSAGGGGVSVNLGTATFSIDAGAGLGVQHTFSTTDFGLAPQTLTPSTVGFITVNLSPVSFPLAPQTITVSGIVNVDLGVVGFNLLPQDLSWTHIRDLGVATFDMQIPSLRTGAGGPGAGRGSSRQRNIRGWRVP